MFTPLYLIYHVGYGFDMPLIKRILTDWLTDVKFYNAGLLVSY